MASRDNRMPVDDTRPLKHSPFGALAAASAALPPGPQPKESPSKGPARAVVRLERKGHGGKEVTVVSHLDLSSPQLADWLVAAKGALGCGGRVEGDLLQLQGDQRDRVAAWLEQRGVRQVTRG